MTLKTDIIKKKCETHSPEWYAHRLEYVNSTDVGAIMNLSPYSVPAKVFNEKIGRIEPWTEGNKHTFLGLYLEEMIADIWRYYDPTGEEDNYVKNHKDGNRIRECKRANGYFMNKKYPWLSTSMDFIADKGQISAMGVVLDYEFPVETKTIDSFVLKQWESIPVYYLIQVHVEMLIMEVKYSEVVLFDSRKNLHIYPIEFDEDLGKQILEVTKAFSDTVKKGRELKKKLDKETDEEKISQLTYELDQLEPSGGQELQAYQDFLKEKYRDSYVEKIQDGSMDDWTYAVDYIKAREAKKVAEKDMMFNRNNLQNSMGENEILSFGEDGKVTYTPNKNGNRTFSVKINN